MNYKSNLSLKYEKRYFTFIYTDTEQECKNITLFVYGINVLNSFAFANLIRTSIT